MTANGLSDGRPVSLMDILAVTTDGLIKESEVSSESMRIGGKLNTSQGKMMDTIRIQNENLAPVLQNISDAQLIMGIVSLVVCTCVPLVGKLITWAGFAAEGALSMTLSSAIRLLPNLITVIHGVTMAISTLEKIGPQSKLIVYNDYQKLLQSMSKTGSETSAQSASAQADSARTCGVLLRRWVASLSDSR